MIRFEWPKRGRAELYSRVNNKLVQWTYVSTVVNITLLMAQWVDMKFEKVTH